ncbi:hypothetical protein RDZ95_000724 [Campylobacter upsaliensis]|nr:hypothetical protein [Campylobacter upsaliensis]EKY8777628.1 hypothetical protein [Campylobacter upsaliensis]HEF3562004.1 hypothetical protein [Campylobacter upsaliensis]
MKLFCLAHASQAHPTNALATRLCLTPPFLCDLLYPHTRGKGNSAHKPHKGFHKAQTTA